MFNEQWNCLAWLLIAQAMNQDLFQKKKTIGEENNLIV